MGRLETYVDPYRSLQDLQNGMTLWNTQSDNVKTTNSAQRILELLEDDLGENFAVIGNPRSSATGDAGRPGCGATAVGAQSEG